MKLYYSPGACSLSPHIVALELGLPLVLDKVDLKAKKTSTGADYLGVNPKGYVPAIEMEDGAVLTEGPAIVQYLADRKPGTLAPANGTTERYRLQEMLGFINSEVHKTYSVFFDNPPDAVRAAATAKLEKRYAYIEKQLAGHDYLFGPAFTVADAYLFVVTSWATVLKLDLSAFPNLLAFQKRVAARPAVRQAMQEEGLIA